MQRNLRLGFAVGLVAALTLALSGSVTASGPSHRTIHVIEHAVTDTEIGTANNNGNILIFHNEVFDQKNQKMVGTDRGDCVRIEFAKGTWECRWTTFLAAGQLTVEGPFNDNSDTVLSITGGTGAYGNARGQMRLIARGNPVGSEFDFIFELTRGSDD